VIGIPSIEYVYAMAVPVGTTGLVNYIETRQLDQLAETAGRTNRIGRYRVARQYVDGLGRKLMAKQEAEPAPGSTAPRVVVNEATLYNARHKPARSLNPYFTLIHGSLEEQLAYEDITAPGWQGQFHQDGKLLAFNAAAGGNLALPEGYESVGPLEVDGFETFQYVINGPTAGGLAANGVTTFSFSVTGLRLSDLTPNAGGYLFAAHIGVPDGTCDGGPCAGLTGFVADGEPVPEVGTLEMFGGALIAFGVLVKRYRLRHA
jgi:hypothetical protein